MVETDIQNHKKCDVIFQIPDFCQHLDSFIAGAIIQEATGLFGS